MAAMNQPIPAEPQTYLWSFPGSPVRVSLALSVVARIQTLLSNGGNAIWGGLLLGEIDGATTAISGFQPLPGPDAAGIKSALAALPPDAGQTAVGYYRIQREEALRLNAEDLTLAKAFFPGPHHVVLLIQQPPADVPTATFYFWDAGHLNGDFPFLEFPFDSTLLSSAEQRRMEAVQRRVLEIPPPAEPAPAPRAERRRSPLKPVAWTLAFLCLAAAVFFGIRSVRPGITLPAISNAAAPAAVPVPVQPSIDLRAERQNGDVKLTWNRETPTIAAATAAQLTIEDGDIRRILTLQASQVRSGSILYTPVTDQVQMAMAVSSPAGDTTESVLVLLPQSSVRPRTTAAPPPAVLSAPQTNTASRTQTVTASRPFVQPAARPRASAPQEGIAAPPSLLASGLPSSAALPGNLAGTPALPVPPPVQQQNTAAPRPATQPAELAYIPPEPLQRVRPVIPVSVRSAAEKPAVVEVTVSIDEKGKVLKAVPLRKPGMDQAAVFAIVAAARQWTFRPAQRGGRPVTSEMVLRFNFLP